MKKMVVLKFLNPLLGLLALNQILTGLFADDLPSGVFAVLHEGGGFAFALAALLHVILNWSWVRATFRRNRAGTTA